MVTVADPTGEYLVSHLSEDDDRLRRRLSDEGYLFFRAFFDPETIRDVRQSLTPGLFEMGLVESPDGEPVWTGRPAAYLDDTPLYSTSKHASLFQSPAVLELLERLFGEPAYVFACSHISYGTPDDGKFATVTHQDGYFSAPDNEFLQMWIPLVDVDASIGGGLAVAPRTHLDGLRPHRVVTQPSYLGKQIEQIGIPLEEVEEDWLTIEYRPGDLLVFSCHTIHRALANRSDKIRLSVDDGAQPASLPRSYYARTSILQRRAFDRLWAAKVASEDASDGADGSTRTSGDVPPNLAMRLIDKAGLPKATVMAMTRREAVDAWNGFLFGESGAPMSS